MAKRDHAAELRRWMEHERLDIRPALRTLPRDIDPELVVPVVLSLLQRNLFWVVGSCRKLPPHVIRAVLAAELDHTDHLLLRLAVVDDGDDAVLAASWHRAVQLLGDLNLTYAWGSRPRRERFRAIASDPHLLHAVQATAAHSATVRIDLLAVLVTDGSDASFDALVPHVDPAFVHGDARLDRLDRLRTHAARTPALDALFAEIGCALDARNAASPVLALGPLLGLGAVDTLWFTIYLTSNDQLDQVARVQGHIGVDSRDANYLHVQVAVRTDPRLPEHAITSFDTTKLYRDDLAVGRCDLTDLPHWLAGVARQLGCTWSPPVPRSNLRGAKRDRLAAWLVPPP